MKIAILNSEKLQSGLLHVVRVGVKRGTNDASDLTGSGVTQTIVVTAIKPGDVVYTHQARLDVITPFVNPVALKADVGIAGVSTIRVLAAASSDTLRQTVAKYAVPTNAGDFMPYVNNTASDVNLIITLTAASGNVSDATAGEFQLMFAISRMADRVTNMEA